MIYCGLCGTHINMTKADQEFGKSTCAGCATELPIFESLEENIELSLFCPGCGKPVYFLEADAGKIVSCVHCWIPLSLSSLKVEQATSIKPPSIQKDVEMNKKEYNQANFEPQKISHQEPQEGIFCAICQTSIDNLELTAVVNCPDCHTIYHDDCWTDNQGCAIYGCSQVPETEHLQSIEIPSSYWGKENKSCPKCGSEILAAAIRCRHCGAVLHTANPMDEEAYANYQTLQNRLPSLKKRVIWLIICCIIPFVAPIAAPISFIWYRRNAQVIKSLPSLYDGLCRIAISIAALQTLLILGVLIFYSFGKPII